MTDKKELKIEFAPGAFDTFEGTQEELDELIAEIHQMFENGEAQENAVILDDNDWDELPDELKEHLIRSLAEDFEETHKRNLQ